MILLIYNKIKAFINFFKPNFVHYKDHRKTAQYKARKAVVKTIWIYTSVLIVFIIQDVNNYGIALGICMFITFLAFMILDY